MDDKDIFNKVNGIKVNTLKKANSLSLTNQFKLINNIQKANRPRPTRNQIPSFNDFDVRDYINIDLSEINSEREEKEQRDSYYKESVLSSLQGIEKNTALLTEMTSLLQTSNDKQAETFELMVEILEIMKSKDQDEANTKFMDVMGKINTFTDNASTVQSLISMASTVYNALPF